MDEPTIICKATRDTYVRFAVVFIALVGFGLYFFYDAAIGYREQNAAMLSYRAFARLGEQATTMTASEWNTHLNSGALIPATDSDGDTIATLEAGGKLHSYPLPPGLKATQSYPDEVRDHAAMSAGWSDCWTAYSAHMHYPIRPGDHPHDKSTIREQWYGGGTCILLACVLLYFIIRTSRREMSLRGTRVCAAGQSFDIADIERIDLRLWGPGFKGAAWFTVKGRRIKADGMTYGGFNKQQGEPAEQFMQAILTRYRGEIIDYEPEPAPDGK